jgi:hypothetical protein
MPVTEKEAKAYLGKRSAGQQAGVAMKQHQPASDHDEEVAEFHVPLSEQSTTGIPYRELCN